MSDPTVTVELNIGNDVTPAFAACKEFSDGNLSSKESRHLKLDVNLFGESTPVTALIIHAALEVQMRMLADMWDPKIPHTWNIQVSS
jgi:hypothetical protein